MELSWLNLIIQASSLAATAGAVWGAIRADLRYLHRQAEDLRAGVERAHARIDVLLADRQG